MYNDDKFIVFKRSEQQGHERLSESFTRREWFCKCGECEDQIMHHLIIHKLEQLRAELGHNPITITSGYRCKVHNSAIGGASKSRHMMGDAADIKVRNCTPLEVAEVARGLGFTGIKTYHTWTHVDLRPGQPWYDYP